MATVKIVAMIEIDAIIASIHKMKHLASTCSDIHMSMLTGELDDKIENEMGATGTTLSNLRRATEQACHWSCK